MGIDCWLLLPVADLAPTPPPLIEFGLPLLWCLLLTPAPKCGDETWWWWCWWWEPKLYFEALLSIIVFSPLTSSWCSLFIPSPPIFFFSNDVMLLNWPRGLVPETRLFKLDPPNLDSASLVLTGSPNPSKLLTERFPGSPVPSGFPAKLAAWSKLLAESRLFGLVTAAARFLTFEKSKTPLFKRSVAGKNGLFLFKLWSLTGNLSSRELSFGSSFTFPVKFSTVGDKMLSDFSFSRTSLVRGSKSARIFLRSDASSFLSSELLVLFVNWRFTPAEGGLNDGSSVLWHRSLVSAGLSPRWSSTETGLERVEDIRWFVAFFGSSIGVGSELSVTVGMTSWYVVDENGSKQSIVSSS